VLACIVFFVSNPFLYSDPIGGTYHILSMNQFMLEHPNPWMTLTIAAKREALWRNTLYFAPLNQVGLAGDRWFLLAGCIALGMTAWRLQRTFWDRSIDVIVVWIIISYIGTGLWLPSDIDRYYLPLQPCNAFLEAYGAVWIAREAYALLLSR